MPFDPDSNKLQPLGCSTPRSTLTLLCTHQGNPQPLRGWSLRLRGHGDLRRMATCDCDLRINVQLVLAASNQERRTPVYLTSAPEHQTLISDCAAEKFVVRLLGRTKVQGLSAPWPMCAVRVVLCRLFQSTFDNRRQDAYEEAEENAKPMVLCGDQQNTPIPKAHRNNQTPRGAPRRGTHRSTPRAHDVPGHHRRHQLPTKTNFPKFLASSASGLAMQAPA